MKRRLFQVAALIGYNGYIFNFFREPIYSGPLKGVQCPGLNCYGCPFALLSCPVGSLQYFTAERLFPFYILGFLGGIGMLVGRRVCGWICPFGFIQDLLNKIRSFRWRLPHWTRYVKYAVLVIVVGGVAYWTLEPWFCKLCPAGAIEAGIPLALWNPFGGPDSFGASIREMIGGLFWLKVSILVLILLLSIPIKRPFCRVLCPLGAIYSLFNRISLYRLEVDTHACAGCNICYRVCPMDINVYEDPNQLDCIRCLECMRACPRNSIRWRFLGFRGGKGEPIPLRVIIPEERR
jgi:ferredoxin-type protein NapH